MPFQVYRCSYTRIQWQAISSISLAVKSQKKAKILFHHASSQTLCSEWRNTKSAPGIGRLKSVIPNVWATYHKAKPYYRWPATTHGTV